jgi:hypothetical protein
VDSQETIGMIGGSGVGGGGGAMGWNQGCR